MRNARFLIASSTLFFLGTLAHFVGGGGVATSDQHFVYLLSILLIVSRLLKEDLGGPSFAAAVVIAQVSTHFLFVQTATSESLMLFSHIFFGGLSYFIAVKTEQLIVSLTTFFYSIVSVFLFLPTKFRVEVRKTLLINIHRSQYILKQLYLTGVQLRAPPIW